MKQIDLPEVMSDGVKVAILDEIERLKNNRAEHARLGTNMVISNWRKKREAYLNKIRSGIMGGDWFLDEINRTFTDGRTEPIIYKGKLNKVNITVPTKITSQININYDLTEGDYKLFNKEFPKWELSWDYLGWKEVNTRIPTAQKDWNQTLITNINQLAAQIHRTSMRGGANRILVHPNLEPIFGNMEYYWAAGPSLAGRFLITYTDKIGENEIYVYLEDLLNPVYKNVVTEGTEDSFSEVTVQLLLNEDYEGDELQETLKRYVGRIEVKNF
jgi:hypothetical protein